LKKFSETIGKGDVSVHESWWGVELWTDHYRDKEESENWDDTLSTAPGYKNYDIGKDGYFWRSVDPDKTDPDSWDCGRTMFWQDAAEIPKVPNAPTSKTLADYAYNKIEVPGTQIGLKPQAKSTVHLPTWVWLDRAPSRRSRSAPNSPTRACGRRRPPNRSPSTWTRARRTRKPFPASGDCQINDDGSIGTPYTEDDAKKAPPCGIRYLRVTNGTPYQLPPASPGRSPGKAPTAPAATSPTAPSRPPRT
jgi:hypothetical protein